MDKETKYLVSKYFLKFFFENVNAVFQRFHLQAKLMALRVTNRPPEVSNNLFKVNISLLKSVKIFFASRFFFNKDRDCWFLVNVAVYFCADHWSSLYLSAGYCEENLGLFVLHRLTVMQSIYCYSTSIRLSTTLLWILCYCTRVNYFCLLTWWFQFLPLPVFFRSF